MSSKNKYIVRRQGEAETPPPPGQEKKEEPKQRPKKKPSSFQPSTIDTTSILEALDGVGDDFLEALIDDTADVHVRRGDTVKGSISKVNSDFMLVSIGTKSEAFINIDDTVGGPFKKGDSITATVLTHSTNGIRLTMNITEAKDEDSFLQAFEDQVPVTGTVKERNSGGYSVLVGQRRAFCPTSQMDYQNDADPDSYIGKELTFLIQELSAKDMLVSRRKILENEAAKIATNAINQINEGATVVGTVKSIKDFGIFVDIGGIQGLIPRSQFKFFQRMPMAGDQIDVDILSINRESKRISLRPKYNDPWLNVPSQFQIGEVIEVNITKIEDFGLFAELRPGVEGLIHIRNLSSKRIHDIRTFSQVGARHRVRILDIDLTKKRIGLGIRQVEEPESNVQSNSHTQTTDQSYTPPEQPRVSHLGQLLQGLKTKK